MVYFWVGSLSTQCSEFRLLLHCIKWHFSESWSNQFKLTQSIYVQYKRSWLSTISQMLYVDFRVRIENKRVLQCLCSEFLCFFIFWLVSKQNIQSCYEVKYFIPLSYLILMFPRGWRREMFMAYQNKLCLFPLNGHVCSSDVSVIVIQRWGLTALKSSETSLYTLG